MKYLLEFLLNTSKLYMLVYGGNNSSEINQPLLCITLGSALKWIELFFFLLVLYCNGYQKKQV